MRYNYKIMLYYGGKVEKPHKSGDLAYENIHTTIASLTTELKTALKNDEIAAVAIAKLNT